MKQCLRDPQLCSCSLTVINSESFNVAFSTLPSGVSAEVNLLPGDTDAFLRLLSRNAAPEVGIHVRSDNRFTGSANLPQFGCHVRHEQNKVS